MKNPYCYRRVIIEVICCLFLLLFIYAAVSKLLDFENFRIQIAQSPVTAAYAGILSVLIPSIEILISIFLVIPRYRMHAMLSAYTLMVIFTIYIIIVLNYSSYVPCSCGGILEEMGWIEHLYFNIGFVFLASVAVVLLRPPLQRIVHPVINLFALGFLGAAIISILYISSDKVMQEHNTFIRNFPYNPNKVYEADLNFNSYYFAGIVGDTLYLGNTTAPLLVTRMDSTLTYTKQNQIVLEQEDLPFQSLKLEVTDTGFYLTDGTVPVIFRGTQTKGWHASLSWRGDIFFSQARAIDSTKMAVRCFDRDNSFTLGTIGLKDGKILIGRHLLQRQIDGRFDVDGVLMSDRARGNLAYQYYYRNQFLVADARLKLLSRGKTIDTINKAQIKVAYVKGRNEYKLSAPPFLVNKNACIDGGYLFVQSALRGRFEKEDMWKESSIIDVYDATSNRYISSFYVYHEKGEKLRTFMVRGNHFYALLGRHLVEYKLHPAIFTTKK